MAGVTGMAVISVNATETGWAGSAPLEQALARLAPGAAVTILIHGYRYSPWDAANDPHRHILSPGRGAYRWKSISWPKHLNLDRADGGLGIGFGWHARGSLRDVAQRAFGLGDTLADLVRALKSRRPDLAVHLFGHSLGARVALAGLGAMAAGDVRRVVLLSGAEYRAEARRSMASPAGRTAQVLNVTSGENALFDAAFRLAIAPPQRGDAVLSRGIAGLAGWTDLRIDCAGTQAALHDLGFRIQPARGGLCHWSTYLRPGLFRFYRAVCDPAQTELFDRLEAALSRAQAKDARNLPRLRFSSL